MVTEKNGLSFFVMALECVCLTNKTYIVYSVFSTLYMYYRPAIIDLNALRLCGLTTQTQIDDDETIIRGSVNYSANI